MAQALAHRIRSSAETEEYDLANYNLQQVQDLVHAAFQEPIPCSEMFRVTFVVGGGKLVRQKYPESLTKDVASALNSIGYQEDRGAHAHISCQGTFKHQHDTDKNLLFVHVFPRVKIEESKDGSGDSEDSSALTPEQLLLTATLADFQKMIVSKVPALTQKRSALKVLRDAKTRLEGIDAKLVAAQQLTADEQSLFDSAVEVADKATWLSAQMDAQATKGPLTSAEQTELLQTLDSKSEQLQNQLGEAQQRGDAKAGAKLQAALDTLKQRRDAVAAVKPGAIPIKRLAELKTLRKQLAELAAIEQAKGLQSLDVIMQLREKPVLLAAQQQIERANRCWFETDAELQARLKAALVPPPGAKSASSSPSSAMSSSSMLKAKKPAAAVKSSSSNPWAALSSD